MVIWNSLQQLQQRNLKVASAMKLWKCARPHTVVLEKKQSTRIGGNEEWSPVQHTQQQEVSAEELGNGANCKTVPKTWNRKVQECA